MPARKPGGRFKGKIPRVKGEATLQAELEAKRRKAYEAQIARLQERRQAEMMAARGLRSADEEAEELKRQRILALFGGGGKAGRLKKFFKYWKMGHVQLKKDKALDERMTCWRRSCDYCGDLDDFGSDHDPVACTAWWKLTLNRTALDELAILNVSPLDPRPEQDRKRFCDCCDIDTGIKGFGCRAFHRLKDSHFEMPFEAQRRREAEQRREMQELQAAGLLTRSTSLSKLDGASASSPFDSWEGASDTSMPSLSSPRGNLTRQGSLGLLTSPLPPAARHRLSPAALARSTGTGILPRVPVQAPEEGDDGARLHEVAHFRSGQRTLLDKYSAKMYVVGVI